MPTATWRCDRENMADEYFDSASGEQPLVGVIISGNSKVGKRRAFIGFDLTRDPDIGARPEPGAQLAAADLLLDITILDGLTAWPGRVERITRLDWAGYPNASWLGYKPATYWTTPGGDVDPALAVAFTSPAALGPYQTGGLLPLAQDAYAARGGLLLIRLMSPEAEAGSFTAQFGTAFGAANDARPRLQLTYAAAATIDVRDPAAITGSRPAGASAASDATGLGRPGRPAHPARPTRS